MSFICKEHKEQGCPYWDNGKATERCVKQLHCLDAVEIWDFRKCKCGTEEKPRLYGEGFARQYLTERVLVREPIRFSQFDGYVVECENCLAVTRHYAKPEDAVDAWNKEALYWDGEEPGEDFWA